MNRKGFISTINAVLALIPVFIVIGSISTINYDGFEFMVVPLERQAQDTVHMLTIGSCPLMNQYLNTTSCIIIGDPLEKIEGSLNDTLSHSYLLEYNLNRGGGWQFLAGRANNGSTSSGDVRSDMDASRDVFSAERIVYNNSAASNVTVRIFLWID